MRSREQNEAPRRHVRRRLERVANPTLGGLLAIVCSLSLVSTSEAAEVVILKSTSVASWVPALSALRQAAPEHTYAELDLLGDRAEGQRIVTGFKGQRLILVALGPLAAQLCRDLAPELPMIFAMVADPVRAGLANLPNATGVIFSIPVLNQLAAYRMVNPRAVRIGVVFNPANVEGQIRAARKAAKIVRLEIVERPVASEREVPRALRELLRGRNAVDAVWIPPDPILLGPAVVGRQQWQRLTLDAAVASVQRLQLVRFGF